MAAANLTEFVSASLRNWRKTLADNVTSHNGLLFFLNENDKIEKTDGGRVLDEPLIYPTNGNTSAKWFSGYDSFSPPTSSEVFDAAEYNWKQLGGFISVSGIEEHINSAEWKRVDYAKARLQQLEATMTNLMGAACYADGTGTSGKEPGGLAYLVADDPTAAGTVGGINQVTQPFWRNQFSAAVATDATNIRTRMDAMWLATLRGSDKCDLIAANSDMYTFYWSSLQEQARFTNRNLADAGFENLNFRMSNVVYDAVCPLKHMYFINTKTLKLRAADTDLFDVGSPRMIQNADYKVIPVWFYGNFTCNNRARNGVIIAS
jgi:hypothetical protein